MRFGNAFSEFGSKRAAEFETRFEDKGDHVVVTGEKFYATGALLAHLVPIVAVDDEGRAWYAIAERERRGPDGDRRLVVVRPAHDAVAAR